MSQPIMNRKMKWGGSSSFKIAASASRALSDNLRVALAVAGPEREDGTASPLRNAQVQRDCGIARSTLEALKSGATENPDLRTLERLADEMGVPLAFLLMRPEDWANLARAAKEAPTHERAMLRTVDEETLSHSVLKEFDHPGVKACQAD